jgi:hypothetical protein
VFGWRSVVYKKAGKFFSASLAGAASGLPQTDDVVQQRRKANQDNPVVTRTGTCVYCGNSPARRRQLENLQSKVKKVEVESGALRYNLRLIELEYNVLYRKYKELFAFVNALPPNLRPNPPRLPAKGKQRKRMSKRRAVKQ